MGSALSIFSGVTSRMRRFLYRRPRYATDVRMDFIIEDTVTLGVCESISESGLRGTLSHPVPGGVTGLLNLYFGERNYQVNAQIQSLHGRQARIRFCFSSNQERAELFEFMKLVLPAFPSLSK